MGKKKLKLLERLRSKPKDFRWNELTKLLGLLGYRQIEGKGSRVKFYLESPRSLISLHKPHPEEILKTYQIIEVINAIERIADGND